MGLEYQLINIDKKEKIEFNNINTGTKLRELSGTIIASTIVTYYLLINIGDRIGFINTTEDRVIVCGGSYKYVDINNFIDVTDQIIEELIKKEILKDNGLICRDKEDNLFYRDLINIWDPSLR